MLCATAGDASDRVKVVGNFFGKAFRRREAERALRATRVAAIARIAVRGLLGLMW